MNDVISSLALVDANQIFFHESHEKVRLDRLIESITNDGFLSHPPIALKLKDENYLLLDGAHRLMALTSMGYKRMVIQVIDEKDVALKAWKHLLPIGEWWTTLLDHPDLIWEEKPLHDQWVARILLENKQQYYLFSTRSTENILDRLEVWHFIVGLYRHQFNGYRIPCDAMNQPQEGEVLISYPQLSLDDLKQVVDGEQLIPAGVSRCIVEGRLLNLRIPLDILRHDTFSKHDWELLRQKWSNSLRFYTEPVYICEG